MIFKSLIGFMSSLGFDQFKQKTAGIYNNLNKDEVAQAMSKCSHIKKKQRKSVKI